MKRLPFLFASFFLIGISLNAPGYTSENDLTGLMRFSFPPFEKIRTLPREGRVETRTAAQDAIKTAESALVSVKIYKPSALFPMPALQWVGTGSGIIISEDGYVLTNKHVADKPNAEYIIELADGTEERAEVVYRDADTDVAVLKIPGSYARAAKLGDSSTLSRGEEVIAMGNAFGRRANSATIGRVTGLNRSVEAGDDDLGSEKLTGLIEVNAPIYPGYSGGPLLDLSGNIIGINVATTEGSYEIGYAIPINDVKNAIRRFL